jgi:ABC-type ATPase with predicted acetyltransferase domain
MFFCLVPIVSSHPKQHSSRIGSQPSNIPQKKGSNPSSRFLTLATARSHPSNIPRKKGSNPSSRFLTLATTSDIQK